MTIDVTGYDDRWPALAEAAIAELTGALPGTFVAVEHIGSTAVPGLAAKPVIDLMAAVVALDPVVRQEPALAALGYRRHDTGMPNRLFYQRDTAGRRSHHLHVVLAESWAGRNERLLRDHLRAHPEDAARYEQSKHAARAAHTDGDAYTRAKTAIIQELTDRARAERGLPPVPVWEE